MREVFADALYWIALANPRDQWHQAALAAEAALGDSRIVTTEEVLTELLAALSSGGAHLRAQAVKIVRAVIADDAVQVLAQSHDTFRAGLDLYEQRADKRYSLTDCISMNTCRERGIADVLTSDHHFIQEGFQLLLKP